jgi:hypothetical protein
VVCGSSFYQFEVTGVPAFKNSGARQKDRALLAEALKSNSSLPTIPGYKKI